MHTLSDHPASADACTDTTPPAGANSFQPADIDRLMNEAFNVPRDPRDPRSLAYRLGVRVIMEEKLLGTPMHVCPYPLGQATADAYFSGHAEGHRIVEIAQWKRERDSLRCMAKAFGGAA
ncbi:hypothetical protein [Polaromonas sp.]|uniref:hypothetical protein n=1 Tax=Polaromonas sp. TaxID=1869339 RepID=UPI003BB685B0